MFEKKVNFNASKSLAHTKWNCKYHIVFAPNYRRKVFFQEKRLDIREILRTLCQWEGVEIIEGEVCPDHIHMLVSIPPKMSVSSFMGYLKGYRSIADTLLNMYGWVVSDRAVWKSMNRLGITGYVRKRQKSETEGAEHVEFANVLNRKFHSEKPMQKVVTDVTYIKHKGKMT